MVSRKSKPPQIGADTEADQILDGLARAHTPREGLEKGTEARVYIDHTGALCIYTRSGLLKVAERDLCYVKGDELV